jgi:hypothetical protein
MQHRGKNARFCRPPPPTPRSPPGSEQPREDPVSRPFFYDIASAKALIGQERPRTNGQVIIKEYIAGRWIEVRIGRVPSRGYTYYRITRAGIKLPDYKVWNDALLTAINCAEELVKDVPAKSDSVTLSGRRLQSYSRLNEFCASQGVHFDDLPEVLGRLKFQIQILNQESEKP